MKKFLLILCLLSISGISYSFDLLEGYQEDTFDLDEYMKKNTTKPAKTKIFDIDKWREYRDLRYAECADTDYECKKRVHKELMSELDMYERNVYTMMNQNMMYSMQESNYTPQRIQYGYNAFGDYVPMSVGGHQIQYGFNAEGEYVPLEY